jgi:hypothetical protein
MLLNTNPVIFQNEEFLQRFNDGIYKVSIGNQLCIGVIISLKMKKINVNHQFFVVLPDYKDEGTRIYSEVLNRHQKQVVSIIAQFNKN